MTVKKYPKLVQCDSRGQIVIPKDVRRELKIDEGSGFWMYTITEEGILLKKLEKPSLKSSTLIKSIDENSSKLKIDRKNIAKSARKYNKKNEGGLELV